MINGPQEIYLKVGGRYRFFLVPGSALGVYTDVQWKTPDETFAVQPLGAHEADDSAYLTQDEVARIATVYVQAHAPQVLKDLVAGGANCFPVLDSRSITPAGLGTEYDVDFRLKPEALSEQRGRDESARVVIWGDRTIDEKDTQLKTGK